MQLKPPSNGKEILDTLHYYYVKHETCTIRFESECGAVALVMYDGVIVSVRGDHFDQNGGFTDILRGHISNISVSMILETTPGHPVDAPMELILFEMAAGMDVRVRSTLNDIRKTGRLPEEVVRSSEITAEFNQNAMLSQRQQIFQLEEGEVVLGRSAEADIVVGEPTVSRKHARIRIQDGIATIENLSTANGTFVNRQLIDSCQLEEDSLISLGNTMFKFFWTDARHAVLFRMSEHEVNPEDLATLVIPY